MLGKEKENIFIGDVSKTNKCQNICLIKAALFISRSKKIRKMPLFDRFEWNYENSATMTSYSASVYKWIE